MLRFIRAVYSPRRAIEADDATHVIMERQHVEALAARRDVALPHFTKLPMPRSFHVCAGLLLFA